MALLIRLRQALVRSSSIPKCCSFSPIASDSSHLINLSKTLFHAALRLENPSIRPIPSKHDRHPPSTSLKNRFLVGPYYRKPETKIPNVDINFLKSPKPSPEEMIEACFQTLPKVLESVEGAKVIEEMSDQFKKSGLEMIEQLKGACMWRKRSVKVTKVFEEMLNELKKSCLEIAEQLKDMLGFILVSPDLDIDRENDKSEGDKCRNEVTTSRLASPPTEYENQLSVEDIEMIDKMPEKLTKYVEVLENLKDYIEEKKGISRPRGRWLSGEMSECIKKKFAGFKEYVEMNESNMPKESIRNKFSLEQRSEYDRIVSISKARYWHTWELCSFGIYNFKALVAELKADHERREDIWRSAVYDFLKSEGLRSGWSKEMCLRKRNKLPRNYLLMRWLVDEKLINKTDMPC